MVDSILPPEQRLPPRQVTFVADQPVGPQQLHTRVKSTLRIFERLSEPQLLGLVEALANSETSEPVLADLQALELRLNELLNTVAEQRWAE